jgi:hypothetical protein
MKRIFTMILAAWFLIPGSYSQQKSDKDALLIFQGLVMDSQNESPLSDVQIFVNRSFSSVSDEKGKFAFNAVRNDTVIFRMLGFSDSRFFISDTLAGSEFIAGVYMHPDTIAIAEVVIIPRMMRLKSDMFSPRSEMTRETENAKNNLAISSYQAHVNQNKLGDPASNYEVLKQRQKDAFYTKGQIPSDRMIGLSPLMLVPAAYMLIKGLPEKPPPPKPYLTEQEVSEIHKRYLHSIKQQ